MPAKTAGKTADSKPKPADGKARAYFVCGDDDFLVQSRARQLVDSLVDKNASDFALEVVEGRSENAAQAVAALKRVDEALNTLAFFGGGKTVWLKNANFFGASRTAESKEVAAQLETLTEVLKRGLPEHYHLVITATEVDKRRSFYKHMGKLGEVIAVGATDPWGKVDMKQLESFALDKARALGKQIEEDALHLLLSFTGGNYRAVASELEKLATYIGDRAEIVEADVRAVGSASAESVVWALADAIGERDLPKALRVLDQLLFQGEEPIGGLFALVSRMRTLLLVRELVDTNQLPVTNSFGMFKGMFETAAAELADELPPDKKLNPLKQHPFVVFKTAQQAGKFSGAELQRAMELLLDANKRLVSSSIDPKIVLEQTLIALIPTRPN
jgi:DNA polymerase-3 subunit delta